MRRLVLSLTLLMCAAWRPATGQLTDVEKTAIKGAVSALQAEFWDAWRAGDFERAVTYYWNSPELTIAIDGRIEHGYEEIVAGARPGYAYVTSMDITLLSSETLVLAPDVACTMEHGTFTATLTNGMTTPAQTYAFTAIWVRDDGEWKIRVMHESFPPTESTEP